MANRKAAEDFIIKFIKKLIPKSDNAKIYIDLFAGMSDKKFDEFIKDLETGNKFLPIIMPNFSDTGLSVENNLKVAEELDYDFFQKLWIEGSGDIPTYLTPIKYLVVDLPLRRASQMLTKKISVPPDNKVIDAMTGQPTGESKGAKMSYPEIQLCTAMGLEKSMVELLKYRGGDNKGHAALNNLISKTGSVNQSTLSHFASGVESTKTLKTYLTAAHLKSTL